MQATHTLREKRNASHDNGLDRVLLELSPVDPYTARDACEGILITGSPGAGKSSTSGASIARAFLSAGYGGLVLTAKSEETLNWKRYAEETGREEDLIVFSAESGHCFDPLFYEWNRPGRGAGDMESIIDMFSMLLSIGKPHQDGGNERFWELAVEQLMRNVLVLLSLSGERISIASIHRVIQSLPTTPNEFQEESWQKESFCAQLIDSIRKRKDSLTPSQWSDLDLATQYVLKKWPGYDERPRSSIEMTWAGMADKFLFQPFNRLFCSGACTFLPEMTTHQGKVVIVDFPMLEYGQETGRLINVLLKLAFQRAWLRRNVEDAPNVAFLWQDEFQYFLLGGKGRDNAFQQTCRGARIAVCCLTQNCLNIAEEFGEQQPGSKTKAFLGNLMLKIAHQQNDPDTATLMAEQIGKQYRYLDSYQSGQQGMGFGGAKQLAYSVEPIEFSRLAKPDGRQPRSAAIVYMGGKHFNATKSKDNPEGANHLTVYFSRDSH